MSETQINFIKQVMTAFNVTEFPGSTFHLTYEENEAGTQPDRELVLQETAWWTKNRGNVKRWGLLGHFVPSGPGQRWGRVRHRNDSYWDCIDLQQPGKCFIPALAANNRELFCVVRLYGEWDRSGSGAVVDDGPKPNDNRSSQRSISVSVKRINRCDMN